MSIAFASPSAPSEGELLSALAESEVCPSDGLCWPRETSIAQHRAPADEQGVLLPIGPASRLHLRVPADGVLRLRYQARGATLAVRVQADGEADRALTLDDDGDAGGGARRARLDLTPWSGGIVRLDLRPQTVSVGGDAERRVLVDEFAFGKDATPDPPAWHVAARPNIVVFLIDTLRADRLGCYGYARPTSPRIDAFARSARLFEDAVAQSSWTLPSTASVLTGRTPVGHGASAVGQSLRRDVPTLAEGLAASGYRTAAFVTNYLVSDAFGLERGFGEFHFYAEAAERRRVVYMPAAAVVRRIAHWLDRRTAAKPFFLYVHVTEPHWPYWPPPRDLRAVLPAGTPIPNAEEITGRSRPYFFGHEHHGERPTSMPAELVARLGDLYDGEVHVADAAFGVLLDTLAAHHLVDTTVVLLTSDHGEEFVDHDGLGHGQTLNQEMLHVPLLLRVPGDPAAGSHVATTVQHVDIAPTLLLLAGAPPAPGTDGRPLEAGPAVDREVYSHLDRLGTKLDAISTERWRLIRDLGVERDGPPPIVAYDRVADRQERHDVAGGTPVLVGYARQLMRRNMARGRRGPDVAPEQLKRLIDLGYVAP